eukprot:745796-Hanusia_phi.AAC.3
MSSVSLCLSLCLSVLLSLSLSESQRSLSPKLRPGVATEFLPTGKSRRAKCDGARLGVGDGGEGGGREGGERGKDARKNGSQGRMPSGRK